MKSSRLDKIRVDFANRFRNKKLQGVAGYNHYAPKATLFARKRKPYYHYIPAKRMPRYTPFGKSKRPRKIVRTRKGKKEVMATPPLWGD